MGGDIFLVVIIVCLIVLCVSLSLRVERVLNDVDTCYNCYKKCFFGKRMVFIVTVVATLQHVSISLVS